MVTDQYSERIAQEAKTWSDPEFHRATQRNTFGYLPQNVAEINRAITGSPVITMPTHLLTRYIFRPGLALFPCCGLGRTAVDAVAGGLCTVAHAFDIAESAVAEAQRHHPHDERFRYFVADGNQFDPGDDRYDLIIVSQAAHHILELERFFDVLRRALKPGGLLVLFDYVGKNFVQRTTEQKREINHLLGLLPERLREAVWGGTKQVYSGDPEHVVRKRSPFEAIRSSEILPVLKRSFTVIEEVPFGSVIPGLFEHIAPAFEKCASPETDAVVRLLWRIDRLLCERGVTAEQVFLVAIPRDAPRPPSGSFEARGLDVLEEAAQRGRFAPELYVRGAELAREAGHEDLARLKLIAAFNALSAMRDPHHAEPHCDPRFYEPVWDEFESFVTDNVAANGAVRRVDLRFADIAHADTLTGDWYGHEAPRPLWGYRWTGHRAGIRLDCAGGEQHVCILVGFHLFRRLTWRTHLSVSLDGRLIGKRSLTFVRPTTMRLPLDTPLEPGAHHVELEVAKTTKAPDGRELGAMVFSTWAE